MEKAMRVPVDLQEISVAKINGRSTNSLDKGITQAIDIIRDSAPVHSEIVHSKSIETVNVTERIFGKKNMKKKTEIIITIMEDLE